MTTHFLPAHRATREQIRQQVETLRSYLLLGTIADAFPETFLIVNRQRQIVFMNEAVRHLAGEEPAALTGKRIGEALHCVHAEESEGGCGTTEFCRMCGAARAYARSRRGEQNTQECRITRTEDRGSLDLQVSATPITLADDRYVAFAVSDIGDEKRRLALERIFFHDVLNLAGALQGYAELQRDSRGTEAGEISSQVLTLAKEIGEELMSQRDLMAAENHDLETHPKPIQVYPFLRAIVAAFGKHPVATGKEIILQNSSDTEIVADPTLLRRILINLLKNALEAIAKGQTVGMGFAHEGGRASFWVHNPTFMPRDIQLQVFQRSFSTKGVGRGIGTYSVKLLTERYLGGNVSFASTRDDGTTFIVTIPECPDETKARSI